MIQSITCKQPPWPGDFMHDSCQHSDCKNLKDLCDDPHSSPDQWTNCNAQNAQRWINHPHTQDVLYKPTMCGYMARARDAQRRRNVNYPNIKPLPQASDGIQITAYGPKCRYHTQVYIYADVLEELQFSAHERNAIGILLGSYALIKRPPNDPLRQTDAQDFIEIKAFRDVYPTADAMDYANYLRTQRNFKPVEPPISLGLVFMQQQPMPPTLEDLMLMRSYFAVPIQISLYICGDRSPAHVYMLDDVSESFAEIGYQVIHLANANPFVS